MFYLVKISPIAHVTSYRYLDKYMCSEIFKFKSGISFLIFPLFCHVWSCDIIMVSSIQIKFFVCLLDGDATFNNISVLSVRSDLLEEETVGHGKNGRPVASHWQTLLHVIMLCTSPRSRFELTTSVVICTNCIGSCKFNYHPITAKTAPRSN